MGCHIPLESSRPLFFSTKGAPLLCLGALRPYWGIYGSLSAEPPIGIKI